MSFHCILIYLPAAYLIPGNQMLKKHISGTQFFMKSCCCAQTIGEVGTGVVLHIPLIAGSIATDNVGVRKSFF